MNSERPDAEFREKLAAAINREVLRGNYRAALPIANRARKRFPDDVVCRYLYAKILGDWADELPAAKKKKLKREAIRILKPLLRSLAGQTPKTRFGICLNFYYQSENFPGMVRFGRRLTARRDRQGYYAVGLGSSLEAMRRFKKSDARAKAWAKKSLAAWRRYDLGKENYYFPHYIEAMAHAVLGNVKSGMTSLGRAARVSGRKLDDWEFADVLDVLTEKGRFG